MATTFEPFQPYGKGPMREWLFAPADGNEAVRAHGHLDELAADFVGERPATSTSAT